MDRGQRGKESRMGEGGGFSCRGLEETEGKHLFFSMWLAESGELGWAPAPSDSGASHPCPPREHHPLRRGRSLSPQSE